MDPKQPKLLTQKFLPASRYSDNQAGYGCLLTFEGTILYAQDRKGVIHDGSEQFPHEFVTLWRYECSHCTVLYRMVQKSGHNSSVNACECVFSYEFARNYL